MRIEHIALSVRDLESAKDFFVKYFEAKADGGYHNPSTGFRSYFLTFGEGARLELTNRPQNGEKQSDPDPIGYSHIAFAVGSKERVDHLTEKLKSGGYEVLSGPRITGDGYYESLIAGFKGNRIEITI